MTTELYLCSYCRGIKPSSRSIHINPTELLSTSLASYCNINCQNLDLANRKRIKAVSRAAWLIQEIFYIYREQVFELTITRTEKRNGNLYVYYDNSWRFINHPTDSLRFFPSALFESRTDRQAVLVHMACTDSLAWMHVLIKHFIKDLTTEIHEILCQPKNPERKIFSVDAKGKLFNSKSSHEFLLLKLHLTNPVNTIGTRAADFSNLFALDLTCAQYGYTDPLQPWADYLTHRVSTRHDITATSFGTALENALWRCSKIGFEGAVALVQRELSKWLVSTLFRWETDMRLSALDLLNLEDEDFEGIKCGLLGCLQQAMQSFLAIEKFHRRSFHQVKSV